MPQSSVKAVRPFREGDVTPVGSSYIENGNANTYDPNQVHDFSWRYDGTNQEAYTAGILTTSTPTSGNIDYSGGSANMTIGTHSSTDLRPPNDEALNADVYEILIYNRALTDTELQEAQEYLADKYKLYDVSATWPLAYSSDVQALIATYQWTKSEADAYLASEAAYPNISSDGLVLHLDSSAGVTTNSSGQVSAWQDQSPWGHSAAQTTEANQPQLITDPATSLPGLQFSGNQYLSSPDTIPANQDLTIISVAEADNTANFTLLGGLGLSSAAGTLRDAGYRANQPEFDTLDNYAQAGNAPPAGVSAVATTTFSYSTGGVNFYVSGSLAGQGTTASSVVANGFTIGSAGWVGNFWTGKISEILVYDRVLSSAEQQAAEVYLADKYKVYHPDATWPLAYSSEVQAEIATNHWTKAQADAYVALQQNTSGVPTAGLHLWLEADAGVTADGGGNVSSWTIKPAILQ
ncbi:MAG: LamG-like jellyroll fold domain-containing protein [Verrucomicrobiota bacterium]